LVQGALTRIAKVSAPLTKWRLLHTRDDSHPARDPGGTAARDLRTRLNVV
jgi:hypothetical protein